MTLFLQLILFPIYGAALYRHRGAKYKYKKYLPRPFNQILFAAPYALLCTPPHVDSWWIAPIVLVLATLGVLTGHGQYFLDGTEKRIQPETLDFLLVPFFGKDPRTRTFAYAGDIKEAFQRIINSYGRKKLYWRNVAGMCVTGLAVTLPAGIALASPVIALSGALKGPAYMAGHYIYDDDGEAATALGEYLCGGFLYLALAVCVVLGYI